VLESEELIQTVLKFTGEDLVFDSATIRGLPSFRTDRLYSSEVTNYVVEQQDFNFQVSSKDVIDNDITIDSVFTMSDNNYVFTFKVNVHPIAYLDNWTRLAVILTAKELI
jgi:hypothetical protein